MKRLVSHPGEHLAEELRALRMSAAELSRQLKIPANRITGILNGQRTITGDTALRLAHFFGTSAQFWLKLQALYELRLAERKAGKAISRHSSELFSAKLAENNCPNHRKKPETSIKNAATMSASDFAVNS